MKHTAAHGNPYVIDTTRIIALGWSAGAFTVLQAAFLETSEELAMIPQADTSQLAVLGGLYGSAYPEHSSRFWAAVSLSGAIYNLNWSPARIGHLITVHPISDSVVYYRTQVGHRGILWHGGKEIDSVAASRGINSAHITTHEENTTLGSDPHYWSGDESVTCGPVVFLEDRLYGILSNWLQDIPLQAEDRYIEIDLSWGRLLRCSLAQIGCFLQYGQSHDCTRCCISMLIQKARSLFRSQKSFKTADCKIDFDSPSLWETSSDYAFLL